MKDCFPKKSAPFNNSEQRRSSF